MDYSIVSFAVVIVGRNSGIGERQCLLNSLVKVLCFLCSGTVFHSAVVDGIKDLWNISFLCGGIVLSRGLRLWCGFLAEMSRWGGGGGGVGRGGGGGGGGGGRIG